jgi:hypothetical protein
MATRWPMFRIRFPWWSLSPPCCRFMSVGFPPFPIDIIPSRAILFHTWRKKFHTWPGTGPTLATRAFYMRKRDKLHGEGACRWNGEATWGREGNDKGKARLNVRPGLRRCGGRWGFLFLAVDGLWSGKRNYLPFGLVENGRCLS